MVALPTELDPSTAVSITPQATFIRRRHECKEGGDASSSATPDKTRQDRETTKKLLRTLQWLKARCCRPVRVLIALSVYVVVTVATISTTQPRAHLPFKDSYQGTTKTTLVLMGYSPKRLSNYEAIFAEYGAMDKAVDQVLFIWNSKCRRRPPSPSRSAAAARISQNLTTSSPPSASHHILYYTISQIWSILLRPSLRKQPYRSPCCLKTKIP